MTVRRATFADIPDLMAMAKAEHGHSRFANIPFDPVRAEQTFRAFIDGMATVVFITERGFIMGMLQPLAFSRLWNAYEMAWYSEDGSGMELLKAFNKWAKDMRAINIVVHNYAGMVAGHKFDRVLARKGFTPIGGTYMKQLGVI
jgi:hypothetical protein